MKTSEIAKYEGKLKEIDTSIFMLEMKDRWTNEDYKTMDEYKRKKKECEDILSSATKCIKLD